MRIRPNLAFALLLFLSGGTLLAQGADACGVCHSTHFTEWSASPHAEAWSNERFQAQWKASGESEFCSRCHAPLSVWQRIDTRTDEEKSLTAQAQQTPAEYEPTLAAVPSAREERLEEGVTCESCHVVQVFSPAGKMEEFLGPYHSTEGHGGKESVEFQTMRLCSSCHARSEEAYIPEGGSLPVDYYHEGARAAAFAYLDSDCNSCHMPQSEGKLVQLAAFKSVPERRVGEHSFGGSRYEMLSEALTVEIVEGNSGMELAITNLAVGHPLQINPRTSYRLQVGIVQGDSVPDPRTIDLEQAADLATGRSVRVPLPEAGEGEKISVRLILERTGQAPRTVLEKTI